MGTVTVKELVLCEVGNHVKPATTIYLNPRTGLRVCAACIEKTHKVRQRRRSLRAWRRRHPDKFRRQTKNWRRRHTESRNISRKRNYDKNRLNPYNIRNEGLSWTTEDLRAITAPVRPSDRVLSAQLGRSVQAIQAARCKYSRKKRQQKKTKQQRAA